ncbi:HNH endonuclease family protein [Spirosoma jeollabukense]
MIKIDKSTLAVPRILANNGKGEKATEKLKSVFDNGDTTFVFDKSIYGHKTVKEVLKKIQHSKCCFCEAKIEHISHGDVEHFRPKAGYQIDENQELVKPGYYWLAYDFANLFFCCQVCNQVYKKNYFPLANESNRAKSHNDDLALEVSLILHPAHDEIAEHLLFEAEIVKPKNGSRKGAETIKRTGLNREFLLKERFEHLKKLRFLEGVVQRNGEQAAEIREAFKEWGRSTNLFSAMVRANFPDLV